MVFDEVMDEIKKLSSDCDDISEQFLINIGWQLKCRSTYTSILFKFRTVKKFGTHYFFVWLAKSQFGTLDFWIFELKIPYFVSYLEWVPAPIPNVVEILESSII